MLSIVTTLLPLWQGSSQSGTEDQDNAGQQMVGAGGGGLGESCQPRCGASCLGKAVPGNDLRAT